MQKVVDFQNSYDFPTPTLGMSANLPHITLIQSFFPVSVISQSSLKSIAANIPSVISAPTTGLSYSAGGWWFVNFEATKEFKYAQGAAFKVLEPHIDLTEIDREKDYSQYSELEQHNYFTYGYRYAGDAFHPHFTMGHDEETFEISDNLIHKFETKFAEEEFIFDRLAWYELGASGACASIIEELQVKTSTV